MTVLCFEESTSFSADCTCRMYQFADVVNLRVYIVSISSPEARAQNLLMADVECTYVSLKWTLEKRAQLYSPDLSASSILR